MSHTDLSIVIPCFNEAKNISTVLQQLQQLITARKESIEVIVIDGASTDDTPEELKKIFSTLPKETFQLILNTARGGYGGDIMTAMAQARGAVLAWTHADLQTDPADILTAYDTYKGLSDKSTQGFIKGARRNRAIMEAFFTFGMQIIVWIVLKTYLSDINAQPKLFSREFYEQYLREDYPSDFSLDLYALYQAKAHGYAIHTVPVYFKKRIHGEAKGGGGGWRMRIKLIQRTFKYILELRNTLK